jgi:hypothetical protein
LLFDTGDIADRHKQVIIDLYARQHRPTDDLPYSKEFDDMYLRFIANTATTPDRHTFWKAVCNLRKNGKLGCKFKTKEKIE